MGGNLDTRTYDVELSKSEVEKNFESDQQASAYESGHSYSGQIGVMPHGIEWKSQTFKTRTEAEEYICENHRKWDKAFGVKTDTIWIVGGWCSS